MFIVGMASAWRLPFGSLLFQVLRRLAFLLVVLLPVGMACAQKPCGPKSGKDPSPATPAVDLFETVTHLPVTVQPLFGGAHRGDMVLTHFKPPGDGPFPAVVMQHGRDSNQRANPAHDRYTDVAHCWVRRGKAEFAAFGPVGISALRSAGAPPASSTPWTTRSSGDPDANPILRFRS